MPTRPIKTNTQDLLVEEEEEIEEVMEDEEEDEEEYLSDEDDDDYDDDEYEYEEDEDEYEERSRLVPYAVTAAALVAFISLGWYAYNAGTDSVSNEELVLIQADQTPVKEKPLDPGGMQFPYQDKSVFETITADNAATDAPAVVSNAEEPMAIEPETNTVMVEDIVPKEPVAEVVATTEEALAKPIEAPAKPAVVEKKVEPLVKEAKPVAQAAPKLAEAKPAAGGAPKAVTTSGNQTVQLGAYRSEADANAAWGKIKSKHNVLAGFNHKVMRADLGEKGVFYRLRVAGVDGAAMCGALKTAGQPCMKVK